MSNQVKLNGLTFAINGHYLAHLKRIYRLFDGDLELCIVLGEIAHYNAGALFADHSERSQSIEEVRAALKGCNAHSISLSSGIPRETVRRKIQKLKDLGWIDSNDKKQIIMTQKVSQDLGGFSKDTLCLFREFLTEIKVDVDW
jgi:CRP-like cAMP-binding protein